jgi:hypothetical protein
MQKPFPTLFAVSFMAGTYVLLGFIYVAVASDWPAFWPPMRVMTRPIEALASTGMAAVGLTLVAGFSFVASALIATIAGGYKLWDWTRGRSENRSN